MLLEELTHDFTPHGSVQKFRTVAESPLAFPAMHNGRNGITEDAFTMDVKTGYAQHLCITLNKHEANILAKTLTAWVAGSKSHECLGIALQEIAKDI